MTTQLRATFVGLLLVAAVLVAAVTVTRHDSTGSTDQTGMAAPVHSGIATPVRVGPYVALGDSYTSGPRIPAQTGRPAGCDRSDHNYPAHVADQLDLRPSDIRDVSCSGATLADLTTPQSTKQGTNPAQLSAISRSTRLVTLGIGGNDIGFSDMITRCVTMGTAFKVLDRAKDMSSHDSPCRESYTDNGIDSAEKRIAGLGAKYTSTLRDIRRRAPEARIYVVGYPAILPAGTTGCGRRLPLAPGDITYLRDKENELNTMLKDQALSTGATYVDTYEASRGHDACAAESTRWIEPIVPSNPAAAVHPNARGQRGMAKEVLRAIRAAG
ncbi:lysophospholipase L1-like esterase [Streptomyces aurantiacus]|uniref:SGNH/GDSL hydrolase family protein n=1 Tax=Streptomyces aurantiacus TaxID=47760 RepID=UPI00278E4DC0|nr:SGNH/GDSL hydrolase family protein [Streptomyces aurantiacus]MDQ0775549.1 lysophospholipase L1-like esterase [Streptomyces aurantiacus]